MPILEIIDISAPQIADDSGTNNIDGERQQEERKPIAFKEEASHMCHNYLAHVSSTPTDADKQTKKHPREPDVAPTSGSVKRPCTTSNKFTYTHSVATKVAATAAAHTTLSHSDASPHITTIDDDDGDEEADNKAHARSVVTSETASSAPLSRGEDIILEATQSYPQVSTGFYYYSSTATQHMFRDRSAFETFQMLLPYSTEAKASGCVKGFCQSSMSYANADGRGTVRVEGRCGKRVVLRDVLHIPSNNSSGHSNIVSGIQLDKAGVITTLGNGHITLSFGEEKIIDGEICDNLYRLNMNTIRPTNLI